MKKIIYVAVIAALVLCVSCKEERVTKINEIARLCFVPGGNGSYWEYIDRNNTTGELNFKVEVTDYNEYRNECDKKKEYSEQISYKLGGKDCLVASNSCTEDQTATIKMAVPHSENLVLTCDAKGNFDCDSTAKIESFSLSGQTYKNVHYFGVKSNTDYYHYYYAEGVGLVHLWDTEGKIFLKLTNYSIQ